MFECGKLNSGLVLVSACLQAVKRAKKNAYIRLISTASMSDPERSNATGHTMNYASVSDLLNNNLNFLVSPLIM